MKKILIYTVLGFLAVASINGCLPKDHLTYEGPTVLEFKNHTLGMLTTVLSARGIVVTPATQVQTDTSRIVTMGTRLTDTIYVQLVGPQSSSPITVNFAPAATTTILSPNLPAVEGTHYNFRPAGARTLTIPANSSVGYLLIDPIPSSLTTTGDIRYLKVNLLGASGIAPSANYKRFTVGLKK